VEIQNLDAGLAESFGLSSERGALVSAVVVDGPAAKGGIEPGDVITRFNGRDIDSTRTLSRVVADAPPSRPATVTVWRDGRSRDLTIQLGEAESEVVAAVSPGAGGQQGGAALGLALRPLTDEDRAQLDMPSDVQGALVANVVPGSDASEKGIRPGDVITSVNQQSVGSVSDVVAALNAAKANGGRALLRVRRGEFQRFVALSFS
jgi:serine protease Do